ncbi:MAG TPA: hypothetical protein VHB98_22470 [Chloroflexota bacterium]|nr:hypothetical protein [Chloroflexota bacterium]
MHGLLGIVWIHRLLIQGGIVLRIQRDIDLMGGDRIAAEQLHQPRAVDGHRHRLPDGRYARANLNGVSLVPVSLPSR